MAMNEDRLYVLSANPHYAIPEESAYLFRHTFLPLEVDCIELESVSIQLILSLFLHSALMFVFLRFSS